MDKDQIKTINDAMSLLSIAHTLDDAQLINLTNSHVDRLKETGVDVHIIARFRKIAYGFISDKWYNWEEDE